MVGVVCCRSGDGVDCAFYAMVGVRLRIRQGRKGGDSLTACIPKEEGR